MSQWKTGGIAACLITQNIIMAPMTALLFVFKIRLHVKVKRSSVKYIGIYN
ncbi:hypothetical protein J32TS6_01830 [Virgibacillus pantothenticus]|nr:hypothetical protein J32TS6_01830 [Virgibacillus pantothenticus]